jgi:hypothetical protein
MPHAFVDFQDYFVAVQYVQQRIFLTQTDFYTPRSVK